ncbi:MAG: tetratricopeptide repeat protein [Deltaproteobacteria bacterium]|nr:tetratricopeptide repeat protein [Deltaproteobacteria bacterium]
MRLFLIAGLVLGLGCATTSSSEPEAPPVSKPEASKQEAPKRRASGRQELERARTLAREEKTAEAIEAAQSAVDAEPGLEAGYLLLASLRDLSGDGDGMREAIERGLAALPKSAALWHAKGMGQLEASTPEVAVVSLREAHVLARKANAEIAADLAFALIFADQLAEAEETAKLARSLAPKALAPAFTHGRALLGLKRPKEAIEALEAAAKIDGSDVSVLRRLADARYLAGDSEKALAEYRALANEAFKDDPEIYVAIATVLIRMERAGEAVEAMKRAVALAPKDERVKALLAEAERRAAGKKGKGKR